VLTQRPNELKPSGVNWLGEVPSHWIVKALKRESPVQRGASPRPIDDPVYFDRDGEYGWVRISDVTTAGTYLEQTEQRLSDLGSSLSVKLQPGALFLSIAGTVGKPCITKIKCCIHDGFVYFPKWHGDTKWLFYIFASGEPYQGLGKFGTQLNLNTDTVGDIRLAFPPLEEQRAITKYLDQETERLDALVTAKERWLELLAEKRRALITHAVTRGLNPAAPLRDSGFPWLGQVPKHWRVERSKWLFKERDERIDNDDGEMLTVSHITGVTKRSEKDVNMFEAETTEGYKICKKGDLAINTLWAWMGAMGIAPCDGIVSPAYNVYTPGPEMDRGFVEALVRMPTFVQEITRYSTGVWSSRLRLYPEGFFEAWLPVPPLAEQRAIVTHIAAATAKLDGLRAAAERTIALLKERRAALIAAAVTGKIQIPTKK